MSEQPRSAAGGRHETALIDPDAEIAPTASVGPFSIVGPGVVVGEGVRIESHVLIERDTVIGEESRISKGAVLGTDPQDLKYEGEPTRLVVGRRTAIREYATLNRGTAATGETRIGDDCLVMAYAHVAHDCRIGNRVVLANAVNMGGHVEIEDWAIVGGLTAIHQFVRVGCHSFVGGGSRLPQDVAPYTMVAGSPCSAFGLNLTGLRRRDFPRDTIHALRDAYRSIFQSRQHLGAALDAFEEVGGHGPEVLHLIEFIRSSQRGITT